MAILTKRRNENIDGNFYVDSTCIDCETCMILAPETFREDGEASSVYKQPFDEESKLKALQALVACPTHSIGVIENLPETKKVRESFPILIEDGVYYNGYHSEKSYGAASYFIQRSKGNILVDSPRYAEGLAEKIKSLGGVKYTFLTHKDDLADQDKYAEYFKAERIFHIDDFNRHLSSVEIPIQGEEVFSIDDDVKIIPTAGHTKGHSVLLLGNKFLFTGDHLAYSPVKQHLHAFRNACWYSWEKQIESMKRLSEFDFEWVLPGHGRRFNADYLTMRLQMKLCIEWMEKK
jgi:glyoxylase-like metal-dependent hydrolase (beta-lactamase superfamily II)/ferredoxin